MTMILVLEKTKSVSEVFCNYLAVH